MVSCGEERMVEGLLQKSDDDGEKTGELQTEQDIV